MLTKEEIEELILSSLYSHDLISKDFYLKCANPSYISELPGNLNTRDSTVLEERLDEIEEKMDYREEILRKADYRLGVKERDRARIEKRLEKNKDTIDKSKGNIADESDKIVKNITKLEDKLGKVDDETGHIESVLKRFKTAHNNFFDLEKSRDNGKTYQNALDDYMQVHDELKTVLESAYNDGLIPKTILGSANCDANFKRINSNMDKIDKAHDKIDKDLVKLEDNGKDIAYIVEESNTVMKEWDILNDAYLDTLEIYQNETGVHRDVRPGVNPHGVGIKLPELGDELEQWVKDTRK